MAKTKAVQSVIVAVLQADGEDRRYILPDGSLVRAEDVAERARGMRLRIGLVTEEKLRMGVMITSPKSVDREVGKLREPAEMVQYRATPKEHTYEWFAIPLAYVQAVYSDLQGARVEEMAPFVLAMRDGMTEFPDEGWVRIEPLGGKAVLLLGKGTKMIAQMAVDADDLALEVHRASGAFQMRAGDREGFAISRYFLAPSRWISEITLRKGVTVTASGRSGVDVSKDRIGVHFPNAEEAALAVRRQKRWKTAAITATAGCVFVIVGGFCGYEYMGLRSAREKVDRLGAEERQTKDEISSLLATRLDPYVRGGQPEWSSFLRDISNAFPAGTRIRTVKVEGKPEERARFKWTVSGVGWQSPLSNQASVLAEVQKALPPGVKITVGPGSMAKPAFVLSGQIERK